MILGWDSYSPRVRFIAARNSSISCGGSPSASATFPHVFKDGRYFPDSESRIVASETLALPANLALLKVLRTLASLNFILFFQG